MNWELRKKQMRAKRAFLKKNGQMVTCCRCGYRGNGDEFQGYKDVCNYCLRKEQRLARGSAWMPYGQLREEEFNKTCALYRKRLALISRYRYDMDNELHTERIYRVLERNGL